MKIARCVHARHGRIAVEWPRRCKYWKRPEVQNAVEEFGLENAKFDGCAVDLLNSKGLPYKKSWTVATNDCELFQDLDFLRCPHGTRKGDHVVLEGDEVKRTELYTEKFLKTIHNAWKKARRYHRPLFSRVEGSTDSGGQTAKAKKSLCSDSVRCVYVV